MFLSFLIQRRQNKSSESLCSTGKLYSKPPNKMTDVLIINYTHSEIKDNLGCVNGVSMVLSPIESLVEFRLYRKSKLTCKSVRYAQFIM